MIHRPVRLPSLFAMIIITGCAQTSVLVRTGPLPRPLGQVRVVLMPPDVQLSELTATGALEPKVDWTEQAIAHVRSALREEILKKNAHLVPHRAPIDDPSEQHVENQILKLHEAVGREIIAQKLTPYRELPTKQGKFDWTLGEGAKRLGERHDAQYALFVVFRESYATPGRVAVMIAAALVRVHIPGGTQLGFASLVDLRSGDVVWFNRLVNPVGDLRTLEPARSAVNSLLVDLPL